MNRWMLVRGPVSLPGFTTPNGTPEGYALLEYASTLRFSVTFEPDRNGRQSMIVQSFDARPYADETAVGSILNAMRGISMVHRATPYVAEGDTAVYVVDALKSASERQLKALDEFDFELLMLVPGSTQIRVRFGREAIRTEDLNWSPDFDWYLRVTWSGPSK